MIHDDEFNPRSEFNYTPLFERCFKGDFFIKVHFSDIYSEKKMLSAFYKKGNACPILEVLDKKLGKEKWELVLPLARFFEV